MDTMVIGARLKKLETCLNRLRKYSHSSLGEYLMNEEIQSVVERQLQLAIQVCIDIANYIIARERLDIPEEEKNMFMILGRHGIIRNDLAERIRSMLSFRNILVYDYLEIDHSIVFRVLTEQLGDLEDYAGDVVAWLERKEQEYLTA